MKKLTTIAQATIGKVTIKATGYVFYQVKSDSSNEYYQLHLGHDGQYHCNCPAHKPCKHERALNEVLDIQTAAIFGTGDKPVAPVAKKAVTSDAPVARSIADQGALNGNRGFSLMR